MKTTVILDEKHFDTAAKRARELGTTTEGYIQSLIDEAGRTFDEILAPVRKGFESSSDDELDALFDRALKTARKSH